MTNKRRVSLLLVMIFLVGLLTGCSATAESVLAKSNEAMDGKLIYQLSFSAPLYMKVGMEGEEMEIDLEMDGTYWMSAEKTEFYAEVNYEGDILGQWLSDRMELYQVLEDDAIVIYTYSKLLDVWARYETGLTAEEFLEFTIPSDQISFEPESLALAEETVNVGGSEAYVLSAKLDTSAVQTEFDEMGGFTGALEKAMGAAELDAETAAVLEEFDFSPLDNLDFTVIEVPVTLYIDKSTYELKQMDMEVVGLQLMLEQFMDVLFTMVEEISGTDMGDLGLTFEIPDIALSYTDFGYEPVEVKSVPEEGVLMAKQQSFDPLQEDGSYVLQESGNAVRVVPQERLDVVYADYCSLELSGQNDGAFTVYSMLDSSWTEEDFMAYVEDNLAEILVERSNAKLLDGEYEGYTVKIIKFGNIKIYYAWKQVGDGWLMVETCSIWTDKDHLVLWPALKAVSDYTLN